MAQEVKELTPQDTISLAEFGITNLNDAWGDTGAVPPGKYAVEATKIQMAKTSNNNPQYRVTYKVINGEMTGRTVMGFYTMTPKAVGRFARVLKAAGVPLSDDSASFSAGDLMGKKLEIETATKTYEKLDPVTGQKGIEERIDIISERALA